MIVTFCSAHSSGTATCATMFLHAPFFAVISTPTRKRIVCGLPRRAAESAGLSSLSFGKLFFGGAGDFAAIARRAAARTSRTPKRPECFSVCIPPLYFARLHVYQGDHRSWIRKNPAHDLAPPNSCEHDY